MIARSRTVRFSLRTVLVLVTLFCFWIAYLGYRYRAQRSAADKIEQLGGFTAWNEPGPAWLKRLIGHDPFAYVWEAGFVDAQVKADDLVSFGKLYGLQRIAIVQNKTFTGDGLQHLAGLDRLRSVYFYNVPVTDEGLGRLPPLPALEELYVLATCVSDSSVGHLVKLRTVKEIQLGSEQLTKDAVLDLGRKLPNTKVSWSGQGFSLE